MKKASIIAIVSLVGLLSACGQGDSAPKTTAAAPAPTEPATPTTAPVAAEPLAGSPTPPPPTVADAAPVAGADDKGKSVLDNT